MSTTNLIGSVGADSGNATVITFSASQYVYVVISGSGNARATYNGATPANSTDRPIVGGSGAVLLRKLGNGGITSISVYVDSASSGATLTYAVTPAELP